MCRRLVLKLTTEREQRVIGCTNVIGSGMIWTKQGSCRVSHPLQRRTNQIHQPSARVFEILGPGSTDWLRALFAAYHGR
jgi:hypothetical protein